MLPHLRSGFAVDQAIKLEEDKVVAIRFGHGKIRSSLKIIFSLIIKYL